MDLGNLVFPRFASWYTCHVITGPAPLPWDTSPRLCPPARRSIWSGLTWGIGAINTPAPGRTWSFNEGEEDPLRFLQEIGVHVNAWDLYKWGATGEQ